MAIPDFTGPFGGIVALAFGAGCGAGYTFARETIVKYSKEKIQELKARVDNLITENKNQVEHLEEEYRTQTENLEINYETKIREVRNDLHHQTERYMVLLKEQEAECTARIDQIVSRYDAIVDRLEKRLVEVEESRVKIALESAQNDNSTS